MRARVTSLYLLLAVCLEPITPIKFEIPKNSSRYLQSVGSSSLYCREGSKGPCQDDQVVVELSSPDYIPIATDYEQLNSAENIKDCYEGEYPAATLPPKGICVWNYPEVSDADIPCPGYPASFMYLTEANQCLSIRDAASFCFGERRKRQRFYADNDKVGGCDCDPDDELYWDQEDTCYRMNTRVSNCKWISSLPKYGNDERYEPMRFQMEEAKEDRDFSILNDRQGPCNDGEWLVLNSSGVPECTTTPCPADGTFALYRNPSNNTVGCYRLGSIGSCPAHQVLKRVQKHPEVIECGLRLEGGIRTHYGIAKGIKLRNCAPGSKLSIHGHCRRILVEGYTKKCGTLKNSKKTS